MDQFRTAYHFQPSRNWINDPNGPMYYNGVYHLFYQYNPTGPLWGNISWGHSVSKDLVNWTPLELALDRTENFDGNGCLSGSVTILPGNKPVILYTGWNPEKHQVQNIAFPSDLSDPFLREWIKPAYNPIIEAVDGLSPRRFRDPTTAGRGNDGQWRMAVGAEVDGHGLAVMYRSADFVHWVRTKDPLHSSKSTKMWECPDFFPVSMEGKRGLDTSDYAGVVKHVMKVSLQSTERDHYLLGRYDEEKEVFVPDNKLDDLRIWSIMDFGNFYASKSFYDEAKNRRIVWAWTRESDSDAACVTRGWSGMQAVPRCIWLDPDGKQLIQWPVEEIESLRRSEVHLRDIVLDAGEMFEINGITAEQADIEVDFEMLNLEDAEQFDLAWSLDPQKHCTENGASVQGGIGPFGLLVLASDNLEEYTAIFFRVYKAQNGYMIFVCSDLEREGVTKPKFGGFINLNLEEERKISLRTLTDHSVIESFCCGGRACITARVYPDHLRKGDTSHVYAFNWSVPGSATVKISNLKAWDMAKARINIEETLLNYSTGGDQ